jgi:hypothetical protein
MPSADQVPVKTPHLTMHWPLWVVLIADRPALHYVLFALPTFNCADGPARYRSRRECGRFPIAFVLRHHCPRHPSELIGERDGGNLGRAPGQQCR